MSLFRSSAVRLASASRSSVAAAPSISTFSLAAAPRTAATAALFAQQPAARRAFATSSIRLGSGTTDAELSSRLQQEISYEQDTTNGQAHAEDGKASSAEPDFLRDFKSQGTWSIQDTPGSDEISLVREYGNEKIKLLFSIGDIDAGAEEDAAFDGEDGAAENEDSDDDPALPVRCAITITKGDQGALLIDAQSEAGQFRIENISFYRDSNLATELTAEADWKRRGLYIGPQFPTLDSGLQEQFQAYLEERGIDDDLALFVPLFAEYKEQKEYCRWLDNVKNWVEA